MRLPVRLALAALCLPLSGCVAVAAGAAAGYGVAQYVRNSDVRQYDAPFSSVWSATVSSMREAGYPVAPDAKPAGNMGTLDLNDATVEVWQISDTTSQVRVRIGTFTTETHRQKSAQIHQGIASRVGAPSPEAPTAANPPAPPPPTPAAPPAAPTPASAPAAPPTSATTSVPAATAATGVSAPATSTAQP